MQYDRLLTNNRNSLYICYSLKFYISESILEVIANYQFHCINARTDMQQARNQTRSTIKLFDIIALFRMHRITYFWIKFSLFKPSVKALTLVLDSHDAKLSRRNRTMLLLSWCVISINSFATKTLQASWNWLWQYFDRWREKQIFIQNLKYF